MREAQALFPKFEEILAREGDSRLRRLMGKWGKNTIFPAGQLGLKAQVSENWKGNQTLEIQTGG